MHKEAIALSQKISANNYIEEGTFPLDRVGRNSAAYSAECATNAGYGLDRFQNQFLH